MRLMSTFVQAVLLLITLHPVAQADDAPSFDSVIATVDDVERTLDHLITMDDHDGLQRNERITTLLPIHLRYEHLLFGLIQQEILAGSHMTPDNKSIRLATKNARRQFTASHLRDANVGIIFEAEIETQHADIYTSPEYTTRYNASHILVPTQEEVRSILTALEPNDDLEALANVPLGPRAQWREFRLVWSERHGIVLRASRDVLEIRRHFATCSNPFWLAHHPRERCTCYGTAFA